MKALGPVDWKEQGASHPRPLSRECGGRGVGGRGIELPLNTGGLIEWGILLTGLYSPLRINLEAHPSAPR